SDLGNFWNSLYSPWGGYYGSYYPGQVIVINNGGDAVNRVSYSKRSSRSSNVNHNVNYTRPSSAATVSGTGRSSISGGRTRTNSPEYYDSGWRRSQNTGATRGYWSTYGNSNNNTTTSDFNRGGSNFGGRQNTGFSSPSRSTFNSGGVNSGGSRSSGSSGSSGGSRTRGRNN
ncbi:MAG: hypothetical protein RIA63_04755, partial [Cyclobacteriaceae bacterium]